MSGFFKTVWSKLISVFSKKERPAKVTLEDLVSQAKSLAKQADALYEVYEMLELEIEDLDRQIEEARTPFDADEELRTTLATKRQELRIPRDQKIQEKDKTFDSGVEVEKQADEMAAIVSRLTGETFEYRSSERFQPVDVEITDEQLKNVIKTLADEDKKKALANSGLDQKKQKKPRKECKVCSAVKDFVSRHWIWFLAGASVVAIVFIVLFIAVPRVRFVIQQSPAVEVPVDVVKEVEVPVEVIKEVEVPVEVIKEVEVPVDVVKEVEVPVDVIKEVEVPVYVEVPVEVPVEVIKEVTVEVPVEVIKEVEVPVEVIKEVMVEVPVEVPADPTVTIDQIRGAVNDAFAAQPGLPVAQDYRGAFSVTVAPACYRTDPTRNNSVNAYAEIQRLVGANIGLGISAGLEFHEKVTVDLLAVLSIHFPLDEKLSFEFTLGAGPDMKFGSDFTLDAAILMGIGAQYSITDSFLASVGVRETSRFNAGSTFQPFASLSILF